MGEDGDITKFDELDESKTKHQRHSNSVNGLSIEKQKIYQGELSTSNRTSSIDVDVDTRDHQRASLSHDQLAKNEKRKASMLACTDMKKMAEMDSRRKRFSSIS